MIVIEETGGGKDGDEFNMYLTGDTERLSTIKDTDEMSPAEFWGSQLFQICQQALVNSGALKNATIINKDGVH